MDKTILVVDDEMAIRMIFENLLGERFNVVCLENGSRRSSGFRRTSSRIARFST